MSFLYKTRSLSSRMACLSASSSQAIDKFVLKIKDLSQSILPIQWNVYCIREICLSN